MWSRRVLVVVMVAAAVVGPSAADVMLCADGPASASFSTTGTTKIAAQCAFDASEPGVLLLIASTGVNETDGWYTVRLRVALNQPAGPGLVGATRTVGVLEGTLTHQTSQASVAVPVGSGTNTVYYLADRTAGDGTVQLYRPRLLALFIPSLSVNLRLCGGFVNGPWTTTAASLGQVTHCTLGGTGLGSALITADGRVDLADFAAEGRFGLGVNSTSAVEDGSERWLDVQGDLLYDGTDTALATSLLAGLGPDTWTFSLLGARSGGSGTVEVTEPSVNVLWVPTGGPILTSGTTLATPWTSTIPTPQTILQTALNPVEDGFAVIVATAAVGQLDTRYTGHFMASIDIVTDIANRYVAIDGLDRNLSLTSVEPMTAGSHTVKLLGYPYDNPAGGALHISDASLAVLFVPRSLVAVWSDGFETGWWERWSAKAP